MGLKNWDMVLCFFLPLSLSVWFSSWGWKSIHARRHYWLGLPSWFDDVRSWVIQLMERGVWELSPWQVSWNCGDSLTNLARDIHDGFCSEEQLRSFGSWKRSWGSSIIMRDCFWRYAAMSRPQSIAIPSNVLHCSLSLISSQLPAGNDGDIFSINGRIKSTAFAGVSNSTLKSFLRCIRCKLQIRIETLVKWRLEYFELCVVWTSWYLDWEYVEDVILHLICT